MGIIQIRIFGIDNMKYLMELGRWKKYSYQSYLKYSMCVAELDSLGENSIMLLGKPRNALGRFVATFKIRCGNCALVYCRCTH